MLIATDHDNVTGTEEEEVGDHYGSCSTPARPGHLHTRLQSALQSAAALQDYYLTMSNQIFLRWV